MAKFEPLHKDTHTNVKIKPMSSVEDLAGQHAIGVVVQEFALAGNQYPIAFVKDEQSQTFFPIAIMGLEQNKNLFVSKDNKWEGRYMPARYTHKPLSVIPNPQKENMYAIAIDVDYPTVQNDEGEALFNEDGSESKYLEERKQALMSYVENEHVTKAFTELLTEHDLLIPQSINVKVKGKEYNLNGLNIIDEKKLNELSDEAFLNIRKRGFLAPIYAHLGSMHQVSSLIQRQAQLLED